MFKFNILKNLNQKIKNIFSQKKLLESLNSGDLVWAKMPLSKKELNKIQESHRIRPYLVAYRDKFFIYAYQCSSKQMDKLNNCQEYLINKIRYKRNKDSFVNLTQIHKIPFINLKQKYLSLNELDLKNIQKRLEVQNNKCIYNFQVKINITEGDVVRIDEELYYVYTCDNAYIYCISVYKKCPKDNKKYKKIIINNKTYYTTFKEKFDFERKTKMQIVNIAYKSEVEEIIKIKKSADIEYKNLTNSEKKVIEKMYDEKYENGTVFQIGKDKIIYLFKYNEIHYGLNLLMYKIKPKTIQINNIQKRKIIEILPKEEFIKIIEFLCLKNVQPLKPINELYNEMRLAVYK